MLNESSRARLVRVMKNIKRKRGDGTVISHEQAFHVKKASPGDRYAQAHTPTPPISSGSQSLAPSIDQTVDDVDPGLPIEEPVEFRLEVQPLTIPWLLAGDGGDEGIADPIPPEIRRRFDPDNRSSRHKDPIRTNVPLFSVKPGEDLLWGAMEGETLNRLRSGIVVATRPSTSASQSLLAKIESTDGVVERAYLRFDSLINPQVFELYNDMYGLKAGDGSLSMRAAASYELAKAAGFDDLIPPTVFRFDEHDGLEPILSTQAASDLASTLGVSIESLRAKLGNSASVELWAEEGTLIWEQPWFSRIAALDGDGLNNVYSVMPTAVWMGLVRGAVFDFLVWNGSRTWADVVFCPEPRHPVHLIRNEMTFADPVAMGTAFLDYRMQYYDGCPDSLQYMPMLWSDVVSMVALRGFDDEATMYESVAVECARRLRGERLVEVVRALTDHHVPARSVAGMLTRVAFLRYGSNIVMRNPLVVAEYFSSLLTGDAFEPGFDIDLEEVELSINETMSKVTHTEFSLVDSMQESEDDQ